MATNFYKLNRLSRRDFYINIKGRIGYELNSKIEMRL